MKSVKTIAKVILHVTLYKSVPSCIFNTYPLDKHLNKRNPINALIFFSMFMFLTLFEMFQNRHKLIIYKNISNKNRYNNNIF